MLFNGNCVYMFWIYSIAMANDIKMVDAIVPPMKNITFLTAIKRDKNIFQ